MCSKQVYCFPAAPSGHDTNAPTMRCLADGTQLSPSANTALCQRQLPYPWLHPNPGTSPYPKTCQRGGPKAQSLVVLAPQFLHQLTLLLQVNSRSASPSAQFCLLHPQQVLSLRTLPKRLPALKFQSLFLGNPSCYNMYKIKNNNNFKSKCKIIMVITG